MKNHYLLTIRLFTQLIFIEFAESGASLVAHTVKNLPAMREIDPTLGWEDPLEEGMATHSSMLAWSISVDSRAWWATFCGVAKSQTRLSN